MNHRQSLCLLLFATAALCPRGSAGDGNRFVHLHGVHPYAPSREMARLATPQWIGEAGVEAAIILSIDDMNQSAPWEDYLRPILERLKEIDGRAPVSIMTNRVETADPQLQEWLAEGLSIEVHTIDHPCPLLRHANFDAARSTYERCVDLMGQIPGNRPVAYRMPCCDSINSVSPRFFAEIFEARSPEGRFLSIDSSVFHVITADDPELSAEIVLDEEGRERFRKYLPFDREFVNTIDDYCYPYVIGRYCWEFPCVVPSDWEAQHLLGANHAQTVRDLALAIDAAVVKEGTFTLVFHPHGWIRNDQVVELVDHAVKGHGAKVRFLTFREADQRLREHLLLGQTLRRPDGGDAGVRILDLDGDGFMDVVIGNEEMQRTRVWSPEPREWRDLDLPVPLVEIGPDGSRQATGVEFGVLRLGSGNPESGGERDRAVLLVRNEQTEGAWYFDGEWHPAPHLLNGLKLDSGPLATALAGVDQGVRLRDLDLDGSCELLVSNPAQSGIFRWSNLAQRWEPLPFSLPGGTVLVDSNGNDGGLRFVDLEGDGDDDLLFSDELTWSVHEFESMADGWKRVRGGKAGEPGSLPLIVRGDTDNGAWFHSGKLWVQNENTANLRHHVDRRSLGKLLQQDESVEPHSPEAALRDFEVAPGFRVELVAAEPLVMDPVAFAFGADARLWVVEMADYPTGVEGEEQGGRIRFLEDRDGDGRYESSALFLKDLPFPTSVLPWRGGVLVTAAPEILYAEDTDGDGRADVRQTLFSGFNPGNPQHRVNGLRLGLDHWVHCANGDSGGLVRSNLTGEVTDISGRDFRIDPDRGALDLETGMTQFGRSRDDWGHWFGGNNSHAFWHFVLPDHYLRRNPDLKTPNPVHEVSIAPGNSRVFPIADVAERFNSPGQAGHFTSACSPDVYRDDLLGRAFTGNLFVCEPVHNLVHREVRGDDGVTFRSRRAPEERQSEFLASRDPWFRPAMVRTGPDGALWIADMQRAVIEHPEWIPDEWEQRIDLREGHELGRIYRVVPADRPPRPIERLDRLSGGDLVERLASRNGVVRDLAQQLLIERRDSSVVEALRQLAGWHPQPEARLQALCTLSAMQRLDADLAIAAMSDSHAEVRRGVVRLAESLLNQHAEVGPALAALTNDVDPKVRLQLAFSLGEWTDPRAGAALAELFHGRPREEPGTLDPERDDAFLSTAVLSSVNPSNLTRLLEAIPKRKSTGGPGSRTLVPDLVSFAAAWGHHQTLAVVLQVALDPTAAGPWFRFSVLGEFFDALERRGVDLTTLRGEAPNDLRTLIDRLLSVLIEARRVLESPEAELAEREVAVRVLGRLPRAMTEDVRVLGSVLQPQQPGELQRVVVQRLISTRYRTVPDLLLAGWSAHAPSLRVLILDGLLRTTAGTRALIAALEDGRIDPHDVDAIRRQRLLVHEEAAIAEIAAVVFEVQVDAAREEVLRRYSAEVLPLEGDHARGNAVFQRRCAVCHQVGEEGRTLGPDLVALSHLGAEALLTAILDPNRAVESKYLTYVARTRDAEILQGLLTRESGNSIVLLDSEAKETVLLRSELERLKSSSQSFMPEGLENDLTFQDMADLIAYLRHHRPFRKEFPGNIPALVEPDGAGAELSLRSSQSEVYGTSLRYVESGNYVGYWSSLDDRAVWTLDLPRPGIYRVVLLFSCADDCAGNVLVLETERDVLHHKVPSTGGWETYEEVDIGEVTLSGGRQQISVHAAEPLHLYLIDLREIRLVPVGG